MVQVNQLRLDFRRHFLLCDVQVRVRVCLYLIISCLISSPIHRDLLPATKFAPLIIFLLLSMYNPLKNHKGGSHYHRHQTLCQYEYNISNGQKIVSNIYNNNKASNAKIGQNVNKAVYFFSCFFRVNLVVCYDSILPKYTSALLFRKLIHHQSVTENLLLDAEV